jgi:hypothetical protein
MLRAVPGQLVAECRCQRLRRQQHHVRPGSQEVTHALAEGLRLDVDVVAEDHAALGVAVAGEESLDECPSGLVSTAQSDLIPFHPEALLTTGSYAAASFIP